MVIWLYGDEMIEREIIIFLEQHDMYFVSKKVLPHATN